MKDDKITIEVTAEMIEAVRQHEKERIARYDRECQQRHRRAEEEFQSKMDASYPGIDADTRYSIYTDYRDFYE